jgi:hypothetical protein
VIVDSRVYRISAVLAGQAADVTVVGRDAAGRELQLALPRTSAQGLEVGHLLILHLSAHVIPELAPASEPAPAEPPPAAVATPPPVVTAPGSCDANDGELCRMLGLG